MADKIAVPSICQLAAYKHLRDMTKDQLIERIWKLQQENLDLQGAIDEMTRVPELDGSTIGPS